MYKVTVFADNTGTTHRTLADAALADLTALLGNQAIAKQVLDRREDIKEVFDSMTELEAG